MNHAGPSTNFHPWHPATPSILHDPIVDSESESEGEFEWYYGESAGGYILKTGKYKRQTLHSTSISYLYWCQRNFSPTLSHYYSQHAFLDAFATFHAGLSAYAASNYGEFRVPFRGTYQGMRIRECRDKNWLLWTQTQEALTRKCPVYFEAVQHWLDNPNHQNVQRDIGECLARTEYEDDADLQQEEDTYDALVLSDEEDEGSFIDHRADDQLSTHESIGAVSSETEGSSNASRRSRRLWRRRNSAEDDDKIPQPEAVARQQTPSFPSPPGPMEAFEPKTPARRKRRLSQGSRPAEKKRRRNNNTRAQADGLVEDMEEDGSEEYEVSESDSSPAGPSKRATRPSKKKQGKTASTKRRSAEQGMGKAVVRPDTKTSSKSLHVHIDLRSRSSSPSLSSASSGCEVFTDKGKGKAIAHQRSVTSKRRRPRTRVAEVEIKVKFIYDNGESTSESSEASQPKTPVKKKRNRTLRKVSPESSDSEALEPQTPAKIKRSSASKKELGTKKHRKTKKARTEADGFLKDTEEYLDDSDDYVASSESEMDGSVRAGPSTPARKKKEQDTRPDTESPSTRTRMRTRSDARSSPLSPSDRSTGKRKQMVSSSSSEGSDNATK
ncbi:hypothetical protein DXG01_012441 [Tephrocybe rancida]|nr:hypothetical protein DXG01_012441 [Tephrocybe rancida]